MKMITVEVTALVDDDFTGLQVQEDIKRGLDVLDTADRYEWWETETTSERPYAEEK